MNCCGGRHSGSFLTILRMLAIIEACCKFRGTAVSKNRYPFAAMRVEGVWGENGGFGMSRKLVPDEVGMVGTESSWAQASDAWPSIMMMFV